LKSLFCLWIFLTPVTAQELSPQERDEYRQEIKQLKERLQLVEDTLQTLLRDRAAATAAPVATLSPVSLKPAPNVPVPAYVNVARKEVTPPELLPEIGKIGAEVGLQLNGATNPYQLNPGTDVAGFIDLPLFDKPDWLHGKISYEISIGISQSKTTFNTTSNVAQVANLSVLNALFPNGGAQNILDAVTGTGSAPFPVTSLTQTKMKLLQVVPFSFKYTTTAFDRFRLRPYALIGFGTYVTIHSQTPTNYGVRTDANLPASVIALVNQIYGGQAPFGGPLVAGQISQSRELEARGLPGGHGNIDLGWLAGGGVEWRVNRSFSLGFDGRWNRIAGSPGALSTYGTRLGFHF
jgi:hypothetical protein